MDNTEALSFLRELFKGKDWFYDADMFNGRLVVYTHFMSEEVMKTVPRDVEGKQVLLHFAACKRVTTDSFVVKPVLHEPKPVVPVAELVKKSTVDIDHEMEYLRGELDRLEGMCNSNTLQDIFFEVHDGKNAITNISSKYPDVREEMVILYEDYGFDVIYEELDG